MALAPTNVPPVNQNFIDKQTLITAGWLNFINEIANSPSIIPTQTAQAAPTTGTWKTGDYVRNSNVTILGTSTAQYIVDGWQCIAGGTPGQWVEVHLAVATTGSSTAPAPAPAPATLYDQVVQGENMSGATALTGAAATISGYLGTGYADWQTAAGVTLSASFANVVAGTYNVIVRYFNYNNQQNTLNVDGVAHTGIMFNQSSPNWSTYTLAGVVLTAGTKVIQWVSDWGYTYIDQIELQQQGAAPAPPPAPAPAPGVSAVAFGSRADGAYPFGIKPTATNATLDGYIHTVYASWKNNRLVKAPTFTAQNGIYAGQSITDAYYVDTNNIWVQSPTYDSAGNVVPGTGVRAGTVSEAVGYGMLICVIMAGYETNAQTYFNGLFRLARGMPAYGQLASYYNGDAGPSKYLMDWRLGLDMSSQGGGWSAADGDMDIALALLMAHRQWGSAGAFNYYQEALNTIAAIKLADCNNSTYMNGLPYVGGGKDVSRTSDYMIGHFRSYKKATNDTFWDDARTNCLQRLTDMVNNYSATAKLVPGWIWQPLSTATIPSSTSAQPSPGGKIESSYEGQFDQNAFRVPARLAADFVWSNDATVKTIATGIVGEIKTKAGGSATALSWMYDLAGNPTTGTNLYYEPTTAGAQVAGACVDVAHQAWLDALVTQISGNYKTDYFGAEWQLLGMIIASGNWWRP